MTFSDDRDATGLGLAFVGSFDGSTCTSEVSLDVEAPGTSETVDLPTPRWAVPSGEPRRAPAWDCSSYPYSGTASSTPLHEEPVVGDAWSLRLRGPPLADPLDDGYAYAAIELRMAYVDRGPSGFDRGDAAQRRFAVAPPGPMYMPGTTRMDSNATSTLMGPCCRPPRCVFGDPQGGRGRAGRPGHRPLRASA